MRFAARQNKTTDHRVTSRGQSSRIRGTAEIELALAIPVLLAIIFLAAAAVKLGVARLDNVFNAEQVVLEDATASQGPQYISSDLTPPDGIEAIRPELPNRMHVADVSKTIDYSAGNIKMDPVTLHNRVALLGATWAYSAYPYPPDGTMLEDWFTRYVEESHADISQPLGLQPAWTP